jgi:hypothetical protein
MRRGVFWRRSPYLTDNRRSGSPKETSLRAPKLSLRHDEGRRAQTVAGSFPDVRTEPRQAAGQTRSSKPGDRRCRPLCLLRRPQAGAAGATLESLRRPAALTAWILPAGERGFSVVSRRVMARVRARPPLLSLAVGCRDPCRGAATVASWRSCKRGNERANARRFLSPTLAGE